MAMQESLMIRDVPRVERPRERLVKYGRESLSNQELIALLLGSGTKRESVLTLSGKVLNHFDGLKLLRQASVEECMTIHGIGEARAVQLLAAVELGSRMASLSVEETDIIRSPADAADLMMEEMRHLTQEHFTALYLNTKNAVIKKKTLFIGSLNASVVHPREVYREALRCSCAAFICLHNHPSGNPEPSPEDIDVTKRLASCGKTMGVEMLDHIIIGDKRYFSMKEKGYI
ncbi:RadC family protein [Alkalicoccus urumqiensis]|uniref:MPN domain-containing protein n=1 Tax=Alkalicoccus urumqiensis TaxID=1548213 RepID=A0A2P6MF38_ALKUR|nr:DNA repair protein RadC [Alkalicoccus urumqiensis]PRO64896.1 hypothetical protein C6I21_12170 [Alkalicoccus urumqiensis]